MAKQIQLRNKKTAHFLEIAKPYLYIMPLFILLGTFKLFSSGYAIYKSFFKWDGGRISQFIGLQNFIDIFSDQIFGKSLVNLFILLVTSVIKSITMPLLVAEMVASIKSKLSNFYKYIFVLPLVIPRVVLLLLWRWIYDYNGLLNGMLSSLGLNIELRSWLGEPSTALPSIIFFQFPWIAGIQFLIFLAGLQSIPASIYESLEIEGITPVKRIFYIDIPMLGGQFRYIIITTIINTFQAFEHVLVMTNGGPGSSTMVPALHLYNETFSYFRMGYSCALGTVLFILTLIITVINMKYIKGSVAID